MKIFQKFPILQFLYAHATDFLPASEWAELLGVKVIDTDGWSDAPYSFDECYCGLYEFVERVSKSTIQPVA